MDIGTIIGLVAALGALALGCILEGGNLGSFFNVPSAMIVFGGTLGAALVCTPLPVFIRALMSLKLTVFVGKSMTPKAAVEMMGELSRLARREGILALEARLPTIEDPFMRKGLQLVVDGTDGEVLRQILQSEIRNRCARHGECASVFSLMGGLGPTLGVIGTVMGLVHMMEKLEDPSSMGPAIAGAFIATLYGVSSANLAFLPLAGKLQARSKEEKFVNMLVMEGIVSLQAGENAVTIEERLNAYLPPKQRNNASTGTGAAGGQRERRAA